MQISQKPRSEKKHWPSVIEFRYVYQHNPKPWDFKSKDLKYVGGIHQPSLKRKKAFDMSKLTSAFSQSWSFQDARRPGMGITNEQIFETLLDTIIKAENYLNKWPSKKGKLSYKHESSGVTLGLGRVPSMLHYIYQITWSSGWIQFHAISNKKMPSIP